MTGQRLRTRAAALMAVFLCAATSIPRAPAAEWAEGTVLGVPVDNPKKPIALFLRYDAASPIPRPAIPPNQWVEVDLSNGPQWDVKDNGDPARQPDLPPDTLAVFLSGLMVITHPGGVKICDLWAKFRAAGSGDQSGYTMQAVATEGGVRSGAATWVPVYDRRFEIYWSYTPGCPSLINLSLQGYVR